MNTDWRQAIRDGLLASYKHREAPGIKCAICGAEHSKYAFNVITYAQSTPNGHIDGSFPICEKCAPPCKKCGLPVATKPVIQFYKRLKDQEAETISIHWGTGICTKHMRIFGITF